MKPILPVVNESPGGPETESKQPWVTQQAVAEHVPNMPGITNYFRALALQTRSPISPSPFGQRGAGDSS